MKGTIYNNFELKNSKGWVRDSLGRKRLLRFKTILSTKTTLVLLDQEYARYTGYYTLAELLKAHGHSEITTPVWLDCDTGKIYKIVPDQLRKNLRNDPDFKLCALFTPQKTT